MGLTKVNHPDGTVENVWTPGPDGQIHVIQTGPVTGSVILADGTVYDVTPEHIQVDKAEHGPAVAFHIAKTHEASGRLGKLVHGEDYDGPALTVTGDETSHGIA
jgi:hypothetical protein